MNGCRPKRRPDEVRGRVEGPDAQDEHEDPRALRAEPAEGRRRVDGRARRPRAAATNPSSPTYSAPNVRRREDREALARVRAGSARPCRRARCRARRAAAPSRRAAASPRRRARRPRRATTPSMGIEACPAAVRSRNASTAGEDDGDPDDERRSRARRATARRAAAGRGSRHCGRDLGACRSAAEAPGPAGVLAPGRRRGRRARSPARASRS